MTFPWHSYEAVLFDLDGVLTPTANVHTRAWKETFDEFLATRASRPDEDTSPFDPANDYRTYVDGRPRYDGVATFLESRGIKIPDGSPGDAPGFGSVKAIGNLKNDRVTAILTTDGVDPYPGSVRLVDALEARGLAMAVVSASANAAAVLESAGLSSRFSVRIDGVVATDLGLRGKPQPDPFLEGARRLGISPDRAVVVEDAVAGVVAGVAGGFGAVIGVDRHDDPTELAAAGADPVVADLGELVPA